MNKTLLIAFACLAGAGAAHAGRCQDPMLTQAFEEVTKRMPYDNGTVGECDPRRYGGGHWSSYKDLVSKVHAEIAKPPATREEVVRPNDQFAPRERYRQKYAAAEQALHCAGLTHIDPTTKGYDVIPHPAVKHAAEVDMPARGGTGPKLCEYVKQPQVQQWYRQNFRI